MIWHATGKCTEPEPRNVRLGLADDGFNPFGNLSQAYSMWPVILTTYNLPTWLCMKESSFMLTLLIPGPKSPGKDIDVYLRPLIEDLKTINDFPARSSLSGWTGKGYKACPTYTIKARQDLQRLGIRSGLWLSQTKNEKCLKPQAVYSFTLENRKKFCQFIKGVELPDGFGSCFKHKVTDNDTNKMGLKSHDCHIMMQRLLPYGLQNYLLNKIAKPIIELCSLFKQICSATLMEDDILKAQIKVVDILCDLELIYPPALFDIIHFVIYLPLEALEGRPICPQWMYPFERYMKKLKGYVEIKLSRKVFRSVCKSIGLRSVIRFDAQELKKVKWYVLHNSPEIETYRSQFKSLFPNKDMKEQFPDWFGSQIRQHHIDNDKDPEVSITNELFALACGPTLTLISINSCVVDGVRYVVYSRDERRITQNSGICSPGPEGEMYYVKRLVLRNNMTQINTRAESFKDDQYILITQVKQVFYLEDKAKPYWRFIEHVNHKKFSDGHVIVVEDDPNIIDFDNSSDLPLSTSLNDLDNVTLHIDGQSTEVDIPPDIIIDVVDKDDDITDDEDALPYDLAESNNEDLIIVDDDDVDKILADVARSHGGDGGGEDRPLHTMYPAVAWVALLTEDKYIEFWNDPRNIARAAQNRQNQAKSTVISRQGSRSLARFRDEMEEMRRLEAMGTYTDDEINRLARGGKQRGHIGGVGRVLPARATSSPSTPAHDSTLNSLHKKMDFMMSIFKSDSKYSDMFSQFESGGASGSGGCGDEEEGANHQDDEDEDGDGVSGATVAINSSGKVIPNDKSPGKAPNCRWGNSLML
nr:hypothetical protein [Tanacetum cinerariifolium]